MLYGFAFFGPIGTKYYPALEKIRLPVSLTPKRFISKEGGNNAVSSSQTQALVTQIIPRVVVDQLAFSPCACAFYYIVMGVFDGITSWRQIKETRLIPNWGPTFATNLAVWPLFQVVNFSVVPVQYRLLAVNVVSVGWNAFISYRNTHHSKPIRIDSNK